MVAYCPRCGTANQTGAPFCGRCGQALGPAPATAVAVAYPYRQVAAPAPAGHGARWLALVGAVAILAVILGAVAWLHQPHVTGHDCGVTCKPPSSPPLGNAHTYTSTDLGYSLDYFDGDLLAQNGHITHQDGHSIAWTVDLGDGPFPIVFDGQAANGRSARQVVEQTQAAKFADATYVYTIPGDELGYYDGFGNVYDVNLASGGGQSIRGRLIVIAAVRKNVAVTLVSVGPYAASSPNDGHPNPSDTYMVDVFDPIVNTVRFAGDPIR